MGIWRNIIHLCLNGSDPGELDMGILLAIDPGIKILIL